MKKIALWFLVQSGFLAILSAWNPTAVYKIHPQPTHEKPVNPLIYGNFIELGLARQIEGLWAEKLYNASFEEVPRQRGLSPDRMTLQEHEISWHYAMNTARQLLLFQRLGGDFEFASFNNLGNTWGQNIIECPKDTVFISAAGRVFELMSRSPLRWVVQTDTLKNLPGVLIQAGVDQIAKNKKQNTNKSQNSKLKTPNGTSVSLTTAPFSVIPAEAGTPPPTTAPFLIIYILNYRN